MKFIIRRASDHNWFEIHTFETLQELMNFREQTKYSLIIKANL